MKCLGVKTLSEIGNPDKADFLRITIDTPDAIHYNHSGQKQVAS
jgi:hypothetical protein